MPGVQHQDVPLPDGQAGGPVQAGHVAQGVALVVHRVWDPVMVPVAGVGHRTEQGGDPGDIDAGLPHGVAT